MTAKQNPRRRQLTSTVLALSVSLLASNMAQGQTADEINAAILTNLGLADTATGQLSAEHQAGLTDFMARTRIFADDLDRAIQAETVAEGRSPREAAESPSLADLHDLLQGLDQEQLVTVMTGYVPGADTTAALARAFADVLPPHLGARRAELEAEFGPRMLGALRDVDIPQYLQMQEYYGLYTTFRALLAERSGEFETLMTEEIFFRLLHEIRLQEQASTYATVERLDLTLAGVFDRLIRGEGNINQRMFALIEPVLREEYARLHPELSAFHLARLERERTAAEADRVTAEADRVTAEADRVTAEADRVTAEADAARETARAIREMLGVPAP
jgi:hypothetical protein